jgi:CRISPR-associated endonuclease Csy4
LGLVEQKIEEGTSYIGISIPKYEAQEFPLGDKLRLFAPERESLESLQIDQRLRRFKDYAHCTSIKETPQSVDRYVCFRRKQIKANIIKKAQRRAKHLNKPFDEVLKFLLDEMKNGKSYECTLPFINLESSSTSDNAQEKHMFKLFIDKEMKETPFEGTFSCYGLSDKTTVPWF